MLKWTGIVIGGVLGLILVTIVVAYVVTGFRASKTFDVPSDPVASSADAQAIERGRHIVHAIAKCADCHGDDFGGKMIVDDPMVGTLYGSNITNGRGSVTKGFTDADFVRAIRYGVRSDRTPLVMMPSSEYWFHDDEELAAIISYIRSLPPVDRETIPCSMGPMIRVMNLFGQAPLFPASEIDNSVQRPPVPPQGATVAYGRHMSTVGGCIGCHGPGLSGGPIPGAPPDWPPSTNITPDPVTGIGKWSKDDFFRAMRTGIRPNGTMINPDHMPWKATALMKDVEMEALYLYLKSTPPKPVGNR